MAKEQNREMDRDESIIKINRRCQCIRALTNRIKYWTTAGLMQTNVAEHLVCPVEHLNPFAQSQ